MKAPLFQLLKELTAPPFWFLPVLLLLPILLLQATITLVCLFHWCLACVIVAMLYSAICVTLPFFLLSFSSFFVFSFLLSLSLLPSTSIDQWPALQHIGVNIMQSHVLVTWLSIDGWGFGKCKEMEKGVCFPLVDYLLLCFGRVNILEDCLSAWISIQGRSRVDDVNYRTHWIM